MRDGEAVARDTALMVHPDLAFVCFGANDQKEKPGRISRGVQVPVDEFVRRLTMTCWYVECAAIGSRAMIITPPDLPPYLSGPYAEACHQTGYPVIDVYTGYDRAWLSEDGWHPDDTGHRFIADAVLAWVSANVLHEDVGAALV